MNVIFGDGGSGKSITIKSTIKGTVLLDGVCYNVLSVQMLELIFVACF